MRVRVRNRQQTSTPSTKASKREAPRKQRREKQQLVVEAQMDDQREHLAHGRGECAQDFALARAKLAYPVEQTPGDSELSRTAASNVAKRPGAHWG